MNVTDILAFEETHVTLRLDDQTVRLDGDMLISLGRRMEQFRAGKAASRREEQRRLIRDAFGLEVR